MKKNPPSQPESATERKAIWVFTPSRTNPKDLEFIFVQRQALLQDSVERVRESALTDHKHHLLFVGPRGSGKTHFVTLLVNRLSEDTNLADRLRIAWLNEDETCTTVLELLLKIYSALEKRYPQEFPEDALSAAYDMGADAAQDFVAQQLLAALAQRTLLVVAENLDAIFENLKDAGQKRLRSFIQENPRLSLVATAQRLENLSERNSPFFGFFQTEHLKPLNVAEATELLQNIAHLHQEQKVVEFLATNRGRSRVRALHHLSGGNHRVYIVLSQFITRDSIDALVGPFMKMIDELTPYYQERIRWLPPQQRKIIELLCAAEGTVPVKEIAKRLFATQPTISSQLQDLREKGYVESNQRGRESLYEISEPLMRICVEVKENQSHEPLRLLVDFLRVWYDDTDLNSRLGEFAAGSACRVYLESAIERNQIEGNLRKRLFLDDLRLSLTKMSEAEREAFVKSCENAPEAVILARKSFAEGRSDEALECLEEAIVNGSDPLDLPELLITRSEFHKNFGEDQKSITDLTTLINLPNAPINLIALAINNRGVIYGQGGETQQAISNFGALINLPGAPVDHVAKALYNRGVAYSQSGEFQEAISDYSSLIDLPGAPVDHVAKALYNRGAVYNQRGETNQAISDYSSVINLLGAPVDQVSKALYNRGLAYARQGKTQQAIADYSMLIDLPGAKIDHVAMALSNRAFVHGLTGETQKQIHDCTALINLPGAPVDLVLRALNSRGSIYSQNYQTHQAIADYSTAIELPEGSPEEVGMALYGRGLTFLLNSRRAEAQADIEAAIRLAHLPHLLLADAFDTLCEIHLQQGRWTQGFEALAASLEHGSKEQPTYVIPANQTINTIFSAGLNPEARHGRTVELLGIYRKYQALPKLGESLVAHLGQLFRKGEPFPSTDNLEQWAAAWEQAAAGMEEFRLPLRLLRTGVNFLKTGGKDIGVLLDLNATERDILEQALGLKERAAEVFAIGD